MRFYQIDTGFLSVREQDSPRYERNNKFIKCYNVKSPYYPQPKRKAEHIPITKEQFKQYIEERIKEFNYQLKVLIKIQSELNNE